MQAVTILTISTCLFTQTYRLQDIQDEAANMLYDVVEGDQGEAVVYSPILDGVISPVELSSILLQHLAKRAEIFLNETVDGAVIAVPANFSQAQRKATLDAAKLAGITTTHLLQVSVFPCLF